MLCIFKYTSVLIKVYILDSGKQDLKTLLQTGTKLSAPQWMSNLCMNSYHGCKYANLNIIFHKKKIKKMHKFHIKTSKIVIFRFIDTPQWMIRKFYSSRQNPIHCRYSNHKNIKLTTHR